MAGISPGTALGPGWRGDNQVRFHCRWWLLRLTEAKRPAPDLGMRMGHKHRL
jgi:hypothetical protein